MILYGNNVIIGDNEDMVDKESRRGILKVDKGKGREMRPVRKDGQQADLFSLLGKTA